MNTNTNYNAEAERRAGTPRRGMKALARFLARALEAEAGAPARPARSRSA